MVSSIEVMVMGLLAEKERHGYELLKEMEERGLLRWNRASKVAVYKALARLEEDGFLTSWMEKGGRMPEKRIYALTAEGEERLRDGVYALCAVEEPVRLEGAAGFAFIDVLSPEEAREALRRRRSFLEKQLKRLKSEREIIGDVINRAHSLLLEREISLYRHEIRWIERFAHSILGEGEEAGSPDT